MAGLSALIGPLGLAAPADRATLRQQLVPWALRSGRAAGPLLAVRFEEEFKTPLAELRARLRLEPAPGDVWGGVGSGGGSVVH